MKIFSDIKSIRLDLEKLKKQIVGGPKNSFCDSLRVGFVPTMGALHKGHLSLISLAKKHCDVVIVSIFVNQKQFNSAQDYARYPNNLAKDLELLQDAKVDILFNPAMEEIYAPDCFTKIAINKLTDHLCGKTRGGHFNAVALIVVKLFNIIKPDLVFFGEKDFQQLQIIRRLVADLNIDLEIISGKTIREFDGLAMSSRNLLLNAPARKIAGQIYQHLCLIKEKIIDNPNINIELILSESSNNLLKIGVNKIDYLQVCGEENLESIIIFNPEIKSRLFIAAYVEEVRLIDNIELL